MLNENTKLELASARTRLENAKGREYWRGLEELAASDGFEEMLHREFPRQASEWDSGNEGRRNFLKLMGASLALGGLSACTRQPEELIFPYVNQPETAIPGKPLFYATAFTMSGISTGILMESHQGRPTKVEGNPQHPASLGATDATTQGSVLGLYDPDRSQTLNFLGEIRSWSSFTVVARQILDEQLAKKGAGLRILTETIGSPTLTIQMKELLTAFPAAKWYQWEPLGHQSKRLGSKMAFGQFVNTVYKFDAADLVVSLDSDFLCSGPASARYSRDFAAKRRVRADQTTMNRMYAIESTPQTTGAKADHRYALKPSEMEGFARALASAVGVAGGAPAPSTKWFGPLVKDLQAHRGTSIVIPGDDQSPEVHALCHAINGALGNVGKTVVYTDPIEGNPADQLADLKQLVGELDAGQVDALFILGGNPVFNAPADLAFAEKLPKAKLRIRLGLYEDETSALCQWHVPETHPLEYWSDGRAYDGTATIIQPLIAPLYEGRSPHEFIALFAEDPGKSAYDLVRANWQKQHTGADFDAWWRKSIHDGVIADSALPAKTLGAAAVPPASTTPASGGGLELSFHADPYIYDGRFANNGWLQELPRPLTRLTWDNAVMVSPATAKKLGVVTEDHVELKHEGRTTWGSVWVTPGQPDDAIAVNVGFGRTRSGRAGNGAGFDAYKLRTSTGLNFQTGVELRKLGKKFPLSSVQMQNTMAGRPVARQGTIAEYIKNNDFAREMNETPDKGMTVYPETFKYEGYAWGMSIDLNSCTGCNACVAACQAENNISIVGKDQVKRGRAMHWLRIDRYYSSSSEDAKVVQADNPQVVFEPVACVHCENAPCELVCPVAATVHDQDGLNNMIYNRCVGTRYCSNNCPYKVRRFNFYLYSDWDTETLKMQKNPDVSVRSRGVMEKCSYCVQRINYAKIIAEKEDRKIHDGEIVTACEAACPAQAIVFGDLNDSESRVRKLKQEGLSYGLLAELNTRPRTTHMAALRNPNPEIEAS